MSVSIVLVHAVEQHLYVHVRTLEHRVVPTRQSVCVDGNTVHTFVNDSCRVNSGGG